MTPMTFLFTDAPLDLQLMDEHRKRYERIKAWREMQSDPYFTEVPTQWREEFGKRRAKRQEKGERG